MRLVAHLVVRNEAGRWLAPCLGRIVDQFEEVAVYDDQSTDETADIVRFYGCAYGRRPDDTPGLLDHEAIFRQTAWRWVIDTLDLRPTDAIVSIDADQTFCGVDNPAQVIADTLQAADAASAAAVPVAEVWSVTSGQPLVRIDGAWAGRPAAKAARAGWQPTFIDRALACGAVPVHRLEQTTPPPLVLCHLGYLRGEDRVEKHARYRNRPGHSRRHIESILTTPVVVPLADLTDGDRDWWDEIAWLLR